MEVGEMAPSLEWGETVHTPKQQVTFTFAYDVNDRHHDLQVDVKVPLNTSADGLASSLMVQHSIPCYLRDNLVNSLNTFLKDKTGDMQKSLTMDLLEEFKENGVKERLLQQWSRYLQKTDTTSKRHSSNSIDTSWSEVYHKLIHSPALEALLQLEHSYSIAMKDVVTKRDLALKELQDKQLVEMELTVEKVGTSKTHADVNRIAANQLEESQMLEIYWSSALSDLQETQKREYRQWVLDVHEKIIAEESFEGIKPNFRRTTSTDSFQVVNHSDTPQQPLLEESFTIHLGTQMKTMHNIRLVCRDILDFCQCKVSYVGGEMVPDPQRLQTAMSLYSQSLSALVLLVDDGFDCSTSNNSNGKSSGVKRNFIRICNDSTEFHFPTYEKQVCVIEQTLNDRGPRKKSVRSGSLRQDAQQLQEQQQQQQQQHKQDTPPLLQTGDFYITKHSNLAEVHAVFHLVTDESTLSTINSRHAIVIGLRNIMLAAARHNITNIVIPLLLVHEMVENLTLQWCLKRAELVLKCVKGFMMESLSWDGHESRTLQFVVPTGVSEETFLAFSNMLPSIFRVSNPLDLSNLTGK